MEKVSFGMCDRNDRLKKLNALITTKTNPKDAKDANVLANPLTTHSLPTHYPLTTHSTVHSHPRSAKRFTTLVVHSSYSLPLASTQCNQLNLVLVYSRPAGAEGLVAGTLVGETKPQNTDD